VIRAVLALFLAAAQVPESPPPPVRLDAVVVDQRGRGVRNLSAADFELYDEGKPQPIDGVEFVAPEIRLFAIFLDEFHVRPGAATLRAREAAARLLQAHVTPNDQVVVFKPLDSLLSVALGTDRAADLAAIESFEGRWGEYEPRSTFERNYMAGTPDRIEATRSQVAVSALHALARHLGRLDASRKTLVIVSEGFAESAPRGREALPTIDGVIRAANRGNVAIYAIDPAGLAGLAPPTGGAGAESTGSTGLRVLRQLTSATTGTVMNQPADLNAGLARLADDAAGHYVLAFRAQPPTNEDRFRQVEVRTKRRLVSVRARSGYWVAPPPPPARAPTAAARAALQQPRRISPLIRPWFGQARGTDGRMRLRFVWEPAPDVPGARARRTLPARITLKALTPDGESLFEGAVRPVGSLVVDAAGSERAVAEFDAPPGRLQIQMSIEDAASRRIDTDVRDVVVASLNGAVAMGSTQVFRARSRRQFRELSDDPRAVPVAAREFSRTEILLMRVPVYGEQPVALTARLLSKIGGAMRPLPVALHSAAGFYDVDLVLASLAVGEYMVEFTAESPAGQAKEMVIFRVTP
jgi:VWFA-related protein